MAEFEPQTRLSVSYEDSSARFKINAGAKSYVQQYSHVYNKRLATVKKTLLKAARERWPGVEVVERIVYASEAGKRVVVVGMTFKEMDQRENILDEYRLEYSFEGPNKPKACYASTEDRIVLEDESGRIALVDGAAVVPVATLVTGLAFAAMGEITSRGALRLEDWCGPGLAPPRPGPRPVATAESAEAPHPKLLLLSGLSGGAGALPLLCDWLAGHAAGDAAVARSVVRCVVAGGLVSKMAADAAAANLKGGDDALVDATDDADSALARLSALVATVAMPGARDPSNVALPQQPLHAVLLPQASRYTKSFVAAPNPHEAVIGDRLVLGTSGQPVLDVLKSTCYGVVSRGNERAMRDGTQFTERHCDDCDDAALAALEDSLWWRHAAPTAPDTLASYPFTEGDPYAIDDGPDVYFSGGMPHFATSLAVSGGSARARLVCLPEFSETGVCALVDLTTLEIERLEFSVGQEDCQEAPPATPMAVDK
ncbi:DNA polymerase alpha/epsilon subunit B-domain-containing protein [Pelagophyceae sp. CCMP2097]|nr:DNA polymerase alpha/epsilon subunit B-domain-containing protein [Pelagophyceae sp. CCMP2097]